MVSLRQNYFIFIGYSKIRGGGGVGGSGVQANPLLDPPLAPPLSGLVEIDEQHRSKELRQSHGTNKKIAGNKCTFTNKA